MKCSHTKIGYELRGENEYSSVTNDYEWVEGQYPIEESCFEDIDLHRMKCSRCGKIEYYSKAAKDYYEKGIPSDYVNPKLK